MIKFCIVITYLAWVANVATAATFAEEQQFIDSLKSIEQVKSKLKKLVIENRDCPSGSCWTATGHEICYTIAALDKKLDYVISNFPSGSAPKWELKKSDVDHLRLMFSQCKIYNFQILLNTVYRPQKAAERRINAWLGVGKR